MISLRLFGRNGGAMLGLLPDFISYDFSAELGDVGALRFDYPLSGINAELLDIRHEVALFDESGQEIANARFFIESVNSDSTSGSATFSISARSILAQCDGALVYPSGGIDSGETSRLFEESTPGAILSEIFADAQTRSALGGLSIDFTASKDSAGKDWPDLITSEYPARSTLLSVVRSLSDFGLIEVSTQGRQIRCFQGSEIGTDRTVGASVVILRRGLNVTDAPVQLSAEKLASVALVEGEDGVIFEEINPDSFSEYGRIEASFAVGGMDDEDAISPLAQAYLDTASKPARQVTIGVALDGNSPRPFIDFHVGDLIYVGLENSVEKMRVRQITYSMSSGSSKASVTLGDRIYEAEIRNARKLSAITSGAVVMGNGQIPAQNPLTMALPSPLPPTELALTPTTYLDAGVERVKVNLSWVPPTLNSDSSKVKGNLSYELYKRNSEADSWEFAGTAPSPTATISNLTPDKSYRFSVRAMDGVNNRSSHSNEAVFLLAKSSTFSAIPSKPTLSTRLGTVTVSWDGLQKNGSAMPEEFGYVEIHAFASTATGSTPAPTDFTPSASTKRGTLAGSGFFVVTDLEYKVDYIFKLVAFTRNNSKGGASDSALANVKPLVDTDIIDKIIDGAKIKAGSIIASDSIIGNTITGALIQGGAIKGGHIDGNTITGDHIVGGSIKAEHISSSYVYAGTISADKITAGTITASISLSAASGNFSGSVSAGGFDITSTYLKNSSGSARINSDTGTATFAGLTVSGSLSAQGGITLGGTLSAGGNAFNNVGAITTTGLTSTGEVSATRLTSSGEVSVSAAASASTTAQPNCYITSGGLIRKTSWSSPSSKKYKENITDIRDVYLVEPKALLKLPVRAFTYKENVLSASDDRAGQMVPGFIAEELEALYPIAVQYVDGDIETYNDRYLVPGLLALIQDQEKRIATIERANP
jgi:Fibronectin type III domain/Chaperone of endosialidase